MRDVVWMDGTLFFRFLLEAGAKTTFLTRESLLDWGHV